MMDVSHYLLGAAICVLVAQLGLSWRIGRAALSLRRFDHRLARHADALTLLTDAVERSFAAVAVEIERFSAERQRPTEAAHRAVTGRVRRAANAGLTTEQIAVSERASEGEIRLRLALADDELPGGMRVGEEGAHGAM